MWTPSIIEKIVVAVWQKYWCQNRQLYCYPHNPPLICCSQGGRDADHQGRWPGGPHERETQLSEGFLPRETEGDKECDKII